MKKTELILSVRDLNIKFNLRGKILHAIRGIDLDVYHGEVLAIVGESGSGKSVFTKSFMGLLDSNGSITSGTIDYFGADDHQPIRLSELKKEKDWLKVRGHEIAMIMQDPMTSLNPLKTIGDQIMEAVELHQGLKGAAAREKTLEYLRDVGIADPEVRFKQYPHESPRTSASWPTSPTVWPSCMPATSWRSAPRTKFTTTPATPTPGRCCPVCPRWA